MDEDAGSGNIGTLVKRHGLGARPLLTALWWEGTPACVCWTHWKTTRAVHVVTASGGAACSHQDMGPSKETTERFTNKAWETTMLRAPGPLLDPR